MKIHTSFLTYIMPAALLLATSCSTVDNVTISAPQKTAIFIPSDLNSPIQSQSDASPIQIRIPGSDYCGFIVAADPVSGLRVPVGLDVKKKRYTGEKAAIGLGYALAGAGTGIMLGGTIVVIGAESNGDEDISQTAALLVAGGAAAAGIGCAIGLPAQSRLNQLSHQYQFTYVPKQSIEFNQLSHTLINADKPKEVSSNSTAPKRAKATTGGEKQSDKQSAGSSVSISRGDKAKRIAGTYIGQGRLLDSKRVEEESYTSIKVVIDRVDKDKVEVSIIESDEEFFADKLIYKIISNRKGTYKLSLENMPSETIEIDSKGNLRFTHNKVNINDEIYSLRITAHKN